MTDFSPHVSHVNYVTNMRYAHSVCICTKTYPGQLQKMGGWYGRIILHSFVGQFSPKVEDMHGGWRVVQLASSGPTETNYGGKIFTEFKHIRHQTYKYKVSIDLI